MPALTSCSVGSSATRLAEGTTSCPRSSKKRRYRRASSADSISVVVLVCFDLRVEAERVAQLVLAGMHGVSYVGGEVAYGLADSGGLVHESLWGQRTHKTLEPERGPCAEADPQEQPEQPADHRLPSWLREPIALRTP